MFGQRLGPRGHWNAVFLVGFLQGHPQDRHAAVDGSRRDALPDAVVAVSLQPLIVDLREQPMADLALQPAHDVLELDVALRVLPARQVGALQHLGQIEDWLHSRTGILCRRAPIDQEATHALGCSTLRGLLRLRQCNAG